MLQIEPGFNCNLVSLVYWEVNLRWRFCQTKVGTLSLCVSSLLFPDKLIIQMNYVNIFFPFSLILQALERKEILL